jgi:AraC-like DNA-binding protein
LGKEGAMKKYLNRRYIRFFSLCFLCLFCISGSLVSGLHIREIRKERSSYQLSLEDETQKYARYFTSGFTSTVDACNNIFLSRWYTHLKNNANIYLGEFDVLRRKEIQEELIGKITAMEFVSDVLIIVPRQDRVISKNGWLSIEEYNKYFKSVEIACEPDGAAQVQLWGNGLCTVILEDVTFGKNRGTIAILLNQKELSSAMEQMRPQGADFVRATMGGQVIYEYGRQQERMEVRTVSSSFPAFSIEAGYLRYEDSLLHARIAFWVLMLIISALASLLLAATITFISFRPLHKLLPGADGEKLLPGSDPYRVLRDYMDSCSAQNRELQQEKAELDALMQRFMELMKNEILFGMLTNPQFDFMNEYICSYIPWIHDGLPYMMAILEPKRPEDTPDEALLESLADPAGHFYGFTILGHVCCALFWLEDPAGAKKLSSRLSQMEDQRYYCAFSDLLQEPEEMRGAYLLLQREIDQQHKEAMELPFTLQLQIAGHIQASRSDACRTLLEQERAAYGPDPFFLLLLRIAGEYDFDGEPAQQEYRRLHAQSPKGERDEKSWQAVLRLAGELCQRVSHTHETGMEQTAGAIRSYIEEHYCDPELCVKQLADEFSMHRTLVSKIFKAGTGMSFSEYLLQLRMKRSQDLLRGSQQSIAAIAEEVGYVNYTTFKRAFIRYAGISPRDYRNGAAAVKTQPG